MKTFPPPHWNYGKIIAGSNESRFDFEYIAKFNYENWYHLLVDNKDRIKLINIENYVDVLCEKHVIYTQTDEITFDDMEPLVNQLNQKLDGNEYFVRLSYRSPKDVPEGRLPNYTAKDVLTSIIKSERCFEDMIAHIHHKLNNVILPSINIVLIPFRECKNERELRCFIFDGKVKAITNQHPDFGWPFKGIESLIVSNIIDFFNTQGSSVLITHSSEMVVDVEIDNNNKIIPIECNPYGKKGSTSGVLFDWERDHDILYNETNIIVLRYSRDRSKQITLCF